MDERDRALVAEWKSRLSSDLRDHVKKIIIFGSRARGKAAEDSDLDVIALVDEKTDEMEKKLEDTAYQVMWDHDFRPIISLKVFEMSKFNDALHRGFSFYKYVEHEGVPV